MFIIPILKPAGGTLQILLNIIALNGVFQKIVDITAIIGFVLTIYYGVKSTRLEKERKKLEWTDLQSCAKDLGAKVRKQFIPDIIITPGLTGATFSNLLIDEFPKSVPVIVGVEIWKDNDNICNVMPDHTTIETNKWFVHIPDSVYNYTDKKVLVVDDFAMSGDFIERLLNLLVEKGFHQENIKTLSIVTTRIAIDNHKAPDYYWYPADDTNFYFPWGKAR